MTSKTFIKVLREIISTEVRKAVRAELQLLNEKKDAPDHRKTINHGMQMYKAVNRKEKQYSKNSALNNILNETANSMRPAELNSNGKTVSWDSMPTMTADDAMNFGHMTSTPNAAPATDLEGKPVNMEALPEELTAAFTRDYSDLLKAMDKKKGN
jgi:hypothetical protein